GLLPAPPHDNYGHTWHHGDGYLFRVTKRGGAAFMMPGQQSNMPGFDVQMTDQEIIDVIEYIMGFWGAHVREFQASASAGDPYP
ncbi:MAG: cytochrome c, partial [Chloroflexota bacterium]|nr:cytochrome c [Chloroflexota bacterium]